MYDDLLPFLILLGVGLLVVLLAWGFSRLRQKYNRAVLARAQAIVDDCHTCDQPLDAHFARVEFPVYANLLVINYEVKVNLYVHAQDRRRLLNRLLLLNLACAFTSLAMPIFLLLALVNFHNNVFRYP